MVMISLHQKEGEIVAWRLLDSSAGNRKMQAMLKNVSKQLKIARVALLTKTNQIREMEDIIVH